MDCDGIWARHGQGELGVMGIFEVRRDGRDAASRGMGAAGAG